MRPEREGRDRRAVLIPAAPGRADVGHLDRTPGVAVVGGGIAGTAAAVALAERGVAVSLFEREADLGGRVSGWSVECPDGTPTAMTRGFHAFFRQYYNLRGLLRRVDPDLALLRPVPDYPLLHRNGTTESFARLPRTPPWSVLSFVLRSDNFTVGDVLKLNKRPAMALFDVAVPRTYDDLDGVDAESFLRGIRFPDAARHLAFEAFSRSFFAHPSRLSAAELVAMFHIYFLGSSEGLLFDVPDDTYQAAIWGPLGEHLRSLGVDVRTGTAVRRVVPGSERRYRVEHDGGDGEFDALVLAADVTGLRSVVRDSPALGDPAWRADVDSLRTAPAFLVSRFWFDRPARPDRPHFLGTSGFAHLDNITVLDRYERTAGRWHAGTGGSVVELHAYALPDGADPDDVARRMALELEQVYPELRGAKALHEEHVVRSDCPLFPPGAFRRRPTVRTPDPDVVLAGDLVRVDLPVALMERAATTGFQAANALLDGWGVRGHDLWSVPLTGRTGVLRRAASLVRRTAG